MHIYVSFHCSFIVNKWILVLLVKSLRGTGMYLDLFLADHAPSQLCLFMFFSMLETGNKRHSIITF